MSSVMQVFIYKKNKADEVLDVTVPCNQILDEPAQGFFFRIDFSSCYPTIYLDYFDFEGLLDYYSVHINSILKGLYTIQQYPHTRSIIMYNVIRWQHILKQIYNKLRLFSLSSFSR